MNIVQVVLSRAHGMYRHTGVAAHQISGQPPDAVAFLRQPLDSDGLAYP
jgi:hypothetical protein